MTRLSRMDTMLIREGDVSRTTRVGRLDSSWSLPPDMVEASIKRVGIIAVAYALTFFMAGVFPALIDPAARGLFFSELKHWLPPVVSQSRWRQLGVPVHAARSQGQGLRPRHHDECGPRRRAARRGQSTDSGRVRMGLDG